MPVHGFCQCSQCVGRALGIKLGQDGKGIGRGPIEEEVASDVRTTRSLKDRREKQIFMSLHSSIVKGRKA